MTAALGRDEGGSSTITFLGHPRPGGLSRSPLVDVAGGGSLISRRLFEEQVLRVEGFGSPWNTRSIPFVSCSAKSSFARQHNHLYPVRWPAVSNSYLDALNSEYMTSARLVCGLKNHILGFAAVEPIESCTSTSAETSTTTAERSVVGLRSAVSLSSSVRFGSQKADSIIVGWNVKSDGISQICFGARYQRRYDVSFRIEAADYCGATSIFTRKFRQYLQELCGLVKSKEGTNEGLHAARKR